MMIPLEPYCLSQDLHRFDCNLSEIVTYKAARDEDGYIDYMGALPPEPKVIICACECNDGLFVLVWEPKMGKEDDNY